MGVDGSYLIPYRAGLLALIVDEITRHRFWGCDGGELVRGAEWNMDVDGINLVTIHDMRNMDDNSDFEEGEVLSIDFRIVHNKWGWRRF